MSVWIEDAKFLLANAMRSVWLGLVTVAWVSIFTAASGLPGETRTSLLVLAALVGVLAPQVLSGLPPSIAVDGLLRQLEKDILAAARERAGGDLDAANTLAGKIAAEVADRIREGRNLPSDRRAWLRLLAQKCVGG